MPPLMQLPAYQTPNALLNFAPVSDGIDSYRKGQEDVRRFGVAQQAGNALMGGDYKGAMSSAVRGGMPELANIAMHAQTNDQQARLNEFKLAREKIDGIGRMAQAALQEPDPARRAAMQQHILSKHDDPDFVKKFPIYATPQGLTLLAAESGHALNALDEQLKRAQINRLNAQAGAQSALANVRDGRAAPEPRDPTSGYGIDEEGNMVPLRGAAPRAMQPANALYGSAMAPDAPPSDIAPQARPSGAASFAPPNNPYGPTGRQADTVPGIVLDDKGKPNPYASRELGGQAAVDAQDAANRRRMQDYMERRQALEYINGGKAPSGKAWIGPGAATDTTVKDTATERAGRMHAEQGIKTLEEAERILGKTGTMSQLAGDTYKIPGTDMKLGGYGEAGRGFRAAESAVLQLNFALSGKSVSNAEREEFQRLYRPTALDSEATQKWKIGEAKKFFQTVLTARKKGMDDDRIAELYRKQLADVSGGPPAEEPAQPGGPVRVNSPQEAAALKPGTRFIGHDGQERVRQ